MQIAFFSQTISNYISGGRYYPYIFAIALAKLGHDITFFTNTDFVLKDELLNTYNVRDKIKFNNKFNDIPRHSKFDLVIGTPLLGADLATTYAKIYNKTSIVLMYETPNWINQFRPLAEPKNYWDDYAIAVKKADYVVCLSNYGVEQAKKWKDIAGVDFRNFHVIYPPINNYSADKVPKQKRKKSVIYSGRCDIHKNAEQLFTIWRNISIKPEEIVIVTGYCPEEIEQQYKALSSETSIPFRLLRNISDEEKFKEIKSASLFLFPSKFEGFGMPPAEAIWCNTPVAAYGIPTLREAYDDAIEFVATGDFAGLREISSQIIEFADRYIDKTKIAKEKIKRWAAFDNFCVSVDNFINRVCNIDNTAIESVQINTNNLSESDLIGRPKFSVIMPLYKPNEAYFKKAINSLLSQTLEEWELCACVDGDAGNAISFLQSVIPESKLKFTRHDSNRGIAEATNSAMELATGEILAFFDQDDILNSRALEMVYKCYNSDSDIEAVYTNEFQINATDKITWDFKKPNFSRELLYQNQYINHLFTIKKDLTDKVGKFNSKYKYSSDYDYVFRATKEAKKVGHVAESLYHYRTTSQNLGNNPDGNLCFATLEQQEIIERAIKNDGKNIKLLHLIGKKTIGRFEIRRTLIEQPKVRIIISTKNLIFVRNLIASIERNTNYENYDIIIIHADKQPKEELHNYLKRLQIINSRIKCIEYKEDFNYSKIHNLAMTKYREGVDYFCLVNDDVIVNKNWLSELVGVAQEDKLTGIVGAKLLYSENKTANDLDFPPNWFTGSEILQHAGVKLLKDLAAIHIYNRMPHTKLAANYVREMEAVTFALVLINAKLFDELKFDEILSCDFNDIDYCICAGNKGWKILYTPWCVAYHFESATRITCGCAGVPANRNHFVNKHRERLINSMRSNKMNELNESGL